MARAALDTRSLALARVGLALLLLGDLAQRALDLRAHYTDEGVLPRSAYELAPWDFAWSVHVLGGSASFELLLFAAAAACAVGLLFGYRTGWMTLACWLFTVSLHGRNPLLRDGQDDLTRVLLFWSLFLPWGSALSVDARAQRRTHPVQGALDGRVTSLGATGFVLQICVVYWVSALGKLLSPWWLAGDGIFYALRVGRYQTPLGQWLSVRSGLATLSFAVLLLEALGPCLWLAVQRWQWRTGVAAAFVLMHAGLALTLRLGWFPLVSMVAWVALLPGGLWDRLGWPARAGAEGQRLAGRPSRVLGVAAVVAMLLVAWCNALYLAPEWSLPRWPQRVAEVFGLQQYWVLFSPRRSSTFALSDGWLVIPAVLRDGQQVDLQRDGKPVDWDRPPVISQTFKSARWRHYFANVANLLLPFPPGSVQFRTLENSRAAYGHWLCSEWNGSHPPAQQISYLSVFLMRYRVDHPELPAQRELLFQNACL